jgi:hypothetical protein
VPAAPTGGTSVIAALAASMAPGTWAKLTPIDQDAVLGVGNVSGTAIHFTNTAPWNTRTRVIEIVGGDHGGNKTSHFRYLEASNTFVLVQDNTGLTPSHGYDHNDVNPYTGDLYTRDYSGFTGSIKVFRKLNGAASYTAIPSVSGADQVAIGTCWWSGSFQGAGSQGCYMIFNSGNATGGANDGQIVAYDPLTNNWFYNQEGRAPYYGGGSTYHSLMEYSAKKNVAVYGGGNVAPNKLWRISADRSVLAMPDVPAGKAVGMQRGNLVCDPVTGNFLLLSAGELWELNPTGSGTWTKQTGSRVPPADVGIPGPDNPQAIVSTTMADYGVVVYITQLGHTGSSFYLYKHA